MHMVCRVSDNRYTASKGDFLHRHHLYILKKRLAFPKIPINIGVSI